MEVCGHTPVWTAERVERTNARGRHRYVPAFKAWIVDQALVPGMSLAGLAMRNQVNANQLRRWVMLRERGSTLAPSQAMLPVVVSTVSEPMIAKVASSSAPIELAFADVTVRVNAGVDAQTLRLVIDALGGVAR